MRKTLPLLALLLVMGVVLVACDSNEPQQNDLPPAGQEVEDAITDTDEVTDAPEDADEPVEATTERKGAWLDTVVVIEEPNADAGVTRLEAGDIDVYAFPISSATTYDRILEAEGLDYKTSYGSYNELTFNPSACTDESKLNPFSVPKIREAMNWLVDRDYIVDEIMGGLGTPRYVPINGASADRGRLAAEIRAIEAKYAHDPEKAREVISEEMEALGATLVDGKWTYQGAPVELIAIIRVEDERTQIGDYVSNQLDDLGFTVIRDYKTSAEAAPIWQTSDPVECLFNFYTGGWVSTQISRDAGSNCNFFYTPAGLPRPLWQAYTPTQGFADLAQTLNDNDFATLDERTELFSGALPLSLEDSVRVWLLDRSSVAPLRDEFEVSSDLSGSIYGTMLWPYTLRFKDQEGGSATWASASILTEVWNPIAGTNWIYDMALIRATGQWSFIPDPNTGLAWPQRFEQFDVTVQEGLPVEKTLDWVTLEFAPEITVPDDAWVDWDAEAQKFVTASETYTQTETALAKVVTTYPADLFDTIKWHDGTPFSMGDMIMMLIMNFDQAKPESAIYDEAQVPSFDSFMSTFKGIRITSTDPVTIEFYTDNWTLDAEGAVSNFRTLWPYYGYGEAPWHTVGLGALAEEKGLAAFSADKATANTIEQFSYIAGPTLEILSEQLVEATDGSYLPYAPTMSEFVTAEEVEERYTKLAEWVRRRGHFWVGTGPLYLERAFPVEGTVILQRNQDFPDPSDKWARFTEPAIAVIEIDGPGRVTPGDEATFDVFVTYNNEPYAADDVQEVKYLVFDATGELSSDGTAEAVADGQWQVVLSGDDTSGLDAGANRLEVVVVSKLVAFPSLGTFQFVTAP
jgi:peptide/nickel transport system substrate-binding protein